MVRTSGDIMDAHPMERMEQLRDISNEKKDTIASKRKELEELEKSKRIEIEELEKRKLKEISDIENKKKKELDELDKKKKELKNLEEKKAQEIEETEELIEKSFQDLMRHKRKIMQDEEESRVSKNALLEDVANTARTRNNNNNNNIPQSNYNDIFEQLRTPRNIYDVANQGFYSNLTELRNRAASGQITPEEERFVDQLRTQFERFGQEASDNNKDSENYFKRSMNVLDQIENYQIKR